MMTHDFIFHALFSAFVKRMKPGGVYQQFEESYSSGTIVVSCGSWAVGGGVAIRSQIFDIFDDIQHSQPDYVLMYSNGYQIAYKMLVDYMAALPKERQTQLESLIQKKIEFIKQTRETACPNSIKT